MPTLIQSNAGKITHDNYNASTGGATKTLPKGTNTILIENMDSTITVLVSFDGGSNFKSIVAGDSLSLDVSGMVVSYQVKSASGSPAVECLYGTEQ